MFIGGRADVRYWPSADPCEVLMAVVPSASHAWTASALHPDAIGSAADCLKVLAQLQWAIRHRDRSIPERGAGLNGVVTFVPQGRSRTSWTSCQSHKDRVHFARPWSRQKSRSAYVRPGGAVV